MRLEKFDSEGVELVGEGGEKKVYINPDNSEEVIAEMREMPKTGEMLQLKGTFYLTKIVHELLPTMIPDVHRVGVSEDEKHTIVSDRIPHTQEYTDFVKAVSEEENVRTSQEKEYSEKHRDGIDAIDKEIDDLGLAFAHDHNLLNYAEDADGVVNYLESFKPWNLAGSRAGDLDVSFDEISLWQEIVKLESEDEKKGGRCVVWMKRLVALKEEAEVELFKEVEIEIIEDSTRITTIESALDLIMSEEVLEKLHNIKTANDAISSQQRKDAREVFLEVSRMLCSLREDTTIRPETYDVLNDRIKELSLAIGTINYPTVNGKAQYSRGIVDHTR